MKGYKMNLFKKINILATKLAVRTIGQLSDGIQLATKEGFTSGKMLEYIYSNKPQGKFFIGKLVDSIYLNHPGWKVIRIRKENLTKNLSEAVAELLKIQDDIFICDVASGPAKYILEVLEEYKEKNVYAQIRDIDVRWLKEAKEKAFNNNLKLEYKVADALNEDDFVFENKNPDIMVASGFYDWFNDEAVIRKSMQLIYNSLKQGGYFVFSTQAGHVDLEMTNAVFKDFNNQQLAMAVWPQEKIREILSDIGFELLKVRNDEFGHYPVMLAIKK